MVQTEYYDREANVLTITCPVVPKAINVTLPDRRGRMVYTARVYRFMQPGGWFDTIVDLENKVAQLEADARVLRQRIAELEGGNGDD